MELNGTNTLHLDSLLEFNLFEYTIFFGMITLSALIGIYFGFKPKKREVTVEDYMLGGRKMPMIPVALSLMASFISGITLLGLPAEGYLFGTQMFGIYFAILVGIVLLNLFYLPVIYNLKFNSLFEYLERRFNRTVRQLSSLVFALSLILYIPVVIYVPSIAFNQVSGMPLEYLAPIVCTVCIFYTSIGGLKAVVWSDALQSLFTILSVFTIMILGIINVGGLSRLIEINEEGERLELFNMDPSLFSRNTFWTTAIGSIPHWLKNLSTHPSTVQRYISLPTYRQAQIVTLLMGLSILLIKGVSTVTGMVLYAEYQHCDPIITKQVQKSDQILPLYILKVAKDFPGLAGLFLSGVVSTALSSMSTGINTAAGTIYEDFLRPVLPWKQTDRAANLAMKVIVVALGTLTTLLVFVVDKLGTVLQVSISLHGVTSGVLMYIFTLGMFIPWANSKGAVTGLFAGLIITGWMMTGAQIYQKLGDLSYGTKVVSIEGCPANLTLPLGLNQTRFGYPGEGTVVLYSDEVPAFFRLSYLLYSGVGFFSSVLTAVLVSAVTGFQDPSELDPNLIIPQLRTFLKKRREEKDKDKVYNLVPTKETD